MPVPSPLGGSQVTAAAPLPAVTPVIVGESGMGAMTPVKVNPRVTSPVSPPWPPTATWYVPPETTGEVTVLQTLPAPASSLAATSLRPSTTVPVYIPRTVSNVDPAVVRMML